MNELVAELLLASERARYLVGDGLAHWVVHDLRRSMATGCQGLGVQLTVTEAILNHSSGSQSGIVGVYQLYEYYDEKAEALQRWADLVEAALGCWQRGGVEGACPLKAGLRPVAAADFSLSGLRRDQLFRPH